MCFEGDRVGMKDLIDTCAHFPFFFPDVDDSLATSHAQTNDNIRAGFF
jgi:hypothetical protein